MKKPLLLVVAGVVWLGTAIGAYFLGTQKSIPNADSITTNTVAGGVAENASIRAKSKFNSPAAGGFPSQVAQAPPGDLPSIIRKAKLLLATGGMMNFNGMVEVGGLLKSIPFDKIPEALEMIEDVRNPQAKQGLYMMLLSRWAENDGAAALAFAEELQKKSGGGMMTGGGAKMVVLQTWGRNDPDAVWDWYVEQEKSGENSGGMFGGNGMALMGVFGGLVGKDPGLAFERLATVENRQAKQMALNGMMQHITDPDVQDALAAYLDGLPKGEKKGAMAGLAGQWAMWDPDGMQEFADSRPDEERRDLLRTAGQTMLWNDPEKGAAMMLENASEEDLPGVYSMIGSTLANQNPKKAEEWLGQQTQGPELDLARSSLAQTIAQNNPEKAMEIAKEITHENQRESAVGSVYQQWRKKNEEAANASLPDSGLTPEAVQRLLDQVDGKPPEATDEAQPTQNLR